MTILRSQFGNLLEPGLQAVFFHEFDTWEPEYPMIYHVKESSKHNEEQQLVVGIGAMPQKSEGAGVTYADISQGYKTTFEHNTFAGGIRVTQEMYEDDLYGIMSDLTTSLARSAIQRMEVDGASTLNNAFSTSYAGTDGAALISATHTTSLGGTQSNALSAAADLSVSSLQEAIQILEDTTDEQGLKVAMKAKTLVCTTANQFTAAELLHSVYRPNTADNAINAIQGKGLNAMTCHYLTDSDSWFLLSDQHKLYWFWRKSLDFFRGNDFDTQDVKFLARMRYSKGFSDFRGVTGSAGA